jgi:tetratricopeptide (TPR) repeat protein
MVLGLEWLIVNNYNGDYVKAEKYFRAAIQINPANHLATHYLGKALLFQKRWQEAEINFKKARKYFVSNADYDRYLVQQILKEKNPDANCILKKIKENYYSAAGDYFCLGDTYIYWGHFQDAENEFKKAISANRLSRNGYYKLWTLLLAQGKYTDAEPVFWDFYYATKNSNEQLGKQYLAFFYNKVVRKFPDNAVWLYKAGSFYYNELKQNSQAYETERNAYKRNIEVKEFQESVNDPLPETYSEADLFKPKNKDTLPDIPSKHINLSERGIIQFPENEIEGTRETIDDGDNIYPYLNGFTFLGKAATVLQNDENALADIYYKMGEITELEDRFLPAMNFYKKSVFFRPDNANYKMKFADNAIACFFYRDALAQLDSLAVQNQIGIRHRLIRADFLMLAGRLAESDTALQQLARFTDSVFAVTPYQLKLAFIQNANKNAIQIAAAELKKDPGNNLLPYLIANLYAKQNKNKEALEWLKKAIDKGFNLGFVVKYDPVWDKMKNNDRWQGIVKMMKPLVYKSTNQVQGN